MTIDRTYEVRLPPDDADLPATRAWFLQELRSIATMMRQPVVPRLYAEPEKPHDGLLVLADGTSWDPGSGRGMYYYDSDGGGSWVFVA